MIDLKPLSKHHFFAQWVILCLALVVIGAFIGLSFFREYRDIEVLERERLGTQARVIDETIAQNLKAIYNALLLIREEMPQWRTSGGQRVNHYLKALDDTIPAIRTILVIDSHGTVQASDRKELIGKNFSYRDYFKVPAKQADPRVLYISPPFRTVTGVLTLNITMVIPGPHGEFNGIISATIEPSYFITVLHTVLYAPEMWSSITHSDGIRFLMVPDQEGQVGKNLAQPGSFFSKHRDSNKDESILKGVSYSTGSRRIIALRTIRVANVPIDKPLIIAISRDHFALYAKWRRQLMVQGTLFGLIAIFGVAGLYFYQRRQKVFDSRAAESIIVLKKSEEKLQRIIDGSPAVIFAKDMDGKYLFINTLFEKLFGVSKSGVKDKTDYDIFPREAAEAFREADLRVLADGVPVEIEETVPHNDGMHYYISLKFPLFDKDDKAYAVCGIATDITERRLREKEREQLIFELQENIAKVKLLSGLLPICSSCKKIRDDKGYWNQIECYIRKHSDAEFTHGICPECAQKLYPKIYDKICNNKEKEKTD